MRNVLMVAIRAFEHRDWLRRKGFKFNHPNWEKLTSSKDEWIAVQAYARGKFKLTYRNPDSTPLSMDHEPAIDEIKKRMDLQAARARTEEEGLLMEKPQSRDKFYVPGHVKAVEAKPYSRRAQAPFTGHASGGPRGFLSEDDPSGPVYFTKRKRR